MRESTKRSGKVEKTPAMKLEETLQRALKLAREVYGPHIDCVQVLSKFDTIATVRA